MALKPKQNKRFTPELRYLLLQLMLVLLFVGIVGQLAFLQIVKGPYYRSRVARQSLRKVWLPALRGKIYDRSMTLLAENRPGFDLDLSLNELNRRSLSNVLKHLSVLLHKPESNLWLNLNPGKRFSFEPAKIASDISVDSATRIAERLHELPAVDITVNPLRFYPARNLASHIVGYVGKISRDDPRLLSGEYSMHDLVGKNGIEREYEYILHGQDGQKIVEVDRKSLFVEVLDRQPPVPGNDIILTIDLPLQAALEQALSNRIGAAVAIDPRNGEVLAMVSSPAYDPNFFVGPVPADQFSVMLNDPRRLFFNRAVQGQYPLGSVFKLMTAVSGLESGVISSNTSYADSGKYSLGDMTVRNFHNARYGRINLLYALRVSCNTFFCNFSTKIGVDTISYYASLFGFGRKTDIELPYEASGLIPSKQWKRDTQHLPWYPGDTVNLSIGHGFLLVTPLQVACMTAAIANNGTLYPPRLVRGYTVGRTINPVAPPAEPLHIPVSSETLKLVQRGMWEVVNTDNGSGKRAALPGVVIAGKTGSAMLATKTYAWFAAYAPFSNPRIAIAVVVENAQTGGRDAAPIARKAFAEYFDLDTPPDDADANRPGTYID